jgi:predicted Zn-dependent protease
MAEMGTAAFEEMRERMPRSQNAAQTRYVRCIADRIVNVLTPQDMRSIVVRKWEVELFEASSANAFALPGGKMGVHSGLLSVAESIMPGRSPVG